MVDIGNNPGPAGCLGRQWFLVAQTLVFYGVVGGHCS